MDSAALIVPLLSSTAPYTFGCASESAVPPNIIANAATMAGALIACHPSLDTPPLGN